MPAAKQYAELLEIIRTLRGEKGCPWDKKQTPDTLKKYLAEECEELLEAISNGDTKNVCEEIGDLFFVLSMLVIIYEEQKAFSSTAPLISICEKMVRRHPHVFEESTQLTEEQLRKQWEQIKKAEKSG